MKQYLVAFNRPLFIRAEDTPLTYENVYGFFADYDENNRSKNKEMKNNIRNYVGYLAAMSLFSCGADDFTLDFSNRNSPNWKDKEGVVHMHHDAFMRDIEKKAVKKLGLSYSLYQIDLDNIDCEFEDCIACGNDRGNITCQVLMDKLVKIAEEQQETEHFSAFLFNRPIFLPKDNFWPGESGYFHIYGLICPAKTEMDETLIDSYQGYLALNELNIMNGQTPSGYTPAGEDGYYWKDKDGGIYSCKSDEMLSEGALCRQKLNLRLQRVDLNAPWKKIAEGVREGLIIDQDLYQSLMETINDVQE